MIKVDEDEVNYEAYNMAAGEISALMAAGIHMSSEEHEQIIALIVRRVREAYGYPPIPMQPPGEG
jgi:hypothetical protein